MNQSSDDENGDIDLQMLDTVDQKFRDLSIPGFLVSFTPDEAEEAGAFEETALSFEDAWEARFDDVAP